MALSVAGGRAMLERMCLVKRMQEVEDYLIPCSKRNRRGLGCPAAYTCFPD